MAHIHCLSQSEADTAAIGRRIGAIARRGDVILLTGELGAGKTALTRGIAAGLGFTGQVTSPSFVLLNEYAGRETLYHVDLYRLAEGDDLEALGLWDYAEQGVLVIEWPERAAELPPASIVVHLEYGDGPNERRLRIEAPGKGGRRVIDALEAA